MSAGERAGIHIVIMAVPGSAWDILERAAQDHPHRLAVVDATAAGPTTLTYLQLYRRAASLAAFLRREGVGRGNMVAVMLHNCRQVVSKNSSQSSSCVSTCTAVEHAGMTTAVSRMMSVSEDAQVLELHFAVAALHAVIVNVNTSLVARCLSHWHHVACYHERKRFQACARIHE